MTQHAGDTAPQEVVDLVERFRKDAPTFRSAGYNEAQVRREFIDPLFRALGWDIDNTSGALESLKDVVHEDSLLVGGVSTAPDYAFRVGGQRQFFLEAKRPSVNIAEASSPAFQLRGYAWSAGLPVSVLCDFEELAIYDCRGEPRPEDGPGLGRLKLFHFEDYLSRWQELADLLSRTAVSGGSLTGLLADQPAPRGSAPVDKAFLGKIEAWRQSLAVELAHQNPGLSVRELNYSVQVLIDRLVFLRICEDRRIEEHGTLERVAQGHDVYSALCRLFKEADARYNSGLFHFESESGRQEHPDKITPRLAVGDSVLRGIIQDLYASGYKFSVMPAEILGQVYEQFLGRVIRLTPEHKAVIETKPEVRKAGGVYYTPPYISQYLIEATIGQRLALHKIGRRWEPPELRIVDPACGSGSFLIAAYQALLDWYLAALINHGPEKHQERLYQGPHGEWRLTSAERKLILVRHIFGVDLDSQAVETTKLSLLLKVLEDESAETLGQNLTLYRERALPDLGDNIKCGNALVSPDFVRADQMSLLDPEPLIQINPFDWNKEFPDVFGGPDPGFDVVIGNPPYISYSGRQAEDLPEPIKTYLFEKFGSEGWPTAHGFFITQAVRRLSRGMVAFIVPAQVGHLDGYGRIRTEITTRSRLCEVRYWGEHVFDDAVTPALTFVADAKGPPETAIQAEDGTLGEKVLTGDEPWIADHSVGLLEAASADAFFLTDEVADPGVHTGNVAKKIILPLDDAPPNSVPVLEGKQVRRYACEAPRKALWQDYEPEEDEYFRVRPETRYSDAPFVIRQTAAFPIVGPRRHATYFRNTLLALYPPADLDVRYVVGLLNSRLIRFLYQRMVLESSQKAFPQVKIKSLRKLPLRRPDLSIPEVRGAYEQVIALVDSLLVQAERQSKASTQSESEAAARVFASLDEQLDQLVYTLYGLNDEQVAAVEEGTRS